MKYDIIVDGCDDSTKITRELTEQEFQFLQTIAQEITKESTYDCMPTMTVCLEGKRWESQE